MGSSFHFRSFPVSGLLSFLMMGSYLCSPEWYTTCKANFVCGNFNIGYPFWGNGRSQECGIPGLELKCENSTPIIQINGLEYRILEMDDKRQILRIAREDYTAHGICGPQFLNTTLDPLVFDYTSGYSNLTITYGCPVDAILGSYTPFSCSISGSAFKSGFVSWEATGLGLCYASIIVPVSAASLATVVIGSAALEESLKQGFEVKWKADDTACADCITSNGVCGYDLLSNQTTCYCPGQFLGSKTCFSSSYDAVPASQGTYFWLNLITTCC